MGSPNMSRHLPPDSPRLELPLPPVDEEDIFYYALDDLDGFDEPCYHARLPTAEDTTLLKRAFEGVEFASSRFHNFFNRIAEEPGFEAQTRNAVDNELMSLLDHSGSGCSTVATESTRLCTNICLGLYDLDSHSIVHDDLKGANVVLPLQDEPMFADFGSAQLVDPDFPLNFSFTTIGGLNGSARWMAPELLLGDESLSPTREADVHAYGMMILSVPVSGMHALASGLSWIANTIMKWGSVPPIHRPPHTSPYSNQLQLASLIPSSDHSTFSLRPKKSDCRFRHGFHI